ncbi:MAG TPA: hypothetical protein ENL27_01070, partial [Candidatus Parcubacteria bacterium]|nr:hypothetical protein [Candidatus Parcubacteria bacterium]
MRKRKSAFFLFFIFFALIVFVSLNISLAKADTCQCSSGVCCDGCHYRPSAWVCGSESQVQYGCPWGLDCGNNVGKKTRIRLKYCSGNSADCNGKVGGWLGWSKWEVADVCRFSEKCVPGNHYCQYSQNCSNKIVKEIPIRSDQDLSMVLLAEKGGSGYTK